MGVPAGFDWEWAKSTGGSLSRRGFLQRLQLIIIIAAQFPSLLQDRNEVAAGVRGTARLEGGDTLFPTTAMAREAEAHAREVLSPATLEHSYRTYLFGKALARYDRAAVDDEAAFIAAMLHDCGLEQPVTGRCFAVRAAESAERLLTDWGAAPERVIAVRDGIAQHITAGVERDLSDIAGLLSAGASLDLFGLRWSHCDPDWICKVVADHPRLDFKNQVIGLVRAEVAAVPDGRTALTYSMGDWEATVRSSPFAE
ncbi:phosphohydrolase [Nocardia sp. NPDC052566]|uniref:phosphohydrolase n=1 Tax=Nocardia sp. NPDC052566 TaxID=3364330 RepID=UPI0037C58650